MTAQSEAVGAPPVGRQRAALSGAENPLVRAVGRAPVKVRTKLLVGFAGIAALLVLVALLGLRVLAQSNARVERVDRAERSFAATGYPAGAGQRRT